MTTIRAKLLLLGAVAGAFAPAVSSAETETGMAAAKTLVENFVIDVATFSGRFEQTLLDPNGELLEASSGRLDIERPGRFRWTYEQPYEQWLVADGVNIWSYDVDLAQVTVKPQDEALANTPAMLLGGSRNAMDDFVIERTGVQDESGQGGTETVWVRLLPKNDDSGFRHVDLGFIDDTLRRMVFLDSLEQTTIVSLSEVRVDEAIDGGTFRFVPPDGVDVVGTPAQRPDDS